MCLVDNRHVKALSLDDACESRRYVVGDNEDAAPRVKVILTRGENLYVVLSQKCEPIEELVPPVKTETRGANHYYGPVTPVQVRDADGLNRLSDAHLVTY